MAWPDLGSALVAKLRADATVQTYVTTAGTVRRIYRKQAPNSQLGNTPYIVWTDVTEMEPRMTPRDRIEALYQVEAWDKRTGADAQPLFQAIHGALNETTLTVSGWTIYECVFVGKQEFLENVSGEQYDRIISEFRIKGSKD